MPRFLSYCTVLAISAGFIWIVYKGYVHNSKLTTSARSLSAQKVGKFLVLISIIIKILTHHFFDETPAHELVQKANAILDADSQMKACKTKLSEGELRTNTDMYFKCSRGLIMRAYKQSGITSAVALDYIDRIYFKSAIDADRSKPMSQEEFYILISKAIKKP